EETRSLLKSPPEARLYSVLKTLLSAGADVNAHNATALCEAVGAASTQTAEMLFETRPHPGSLDFALPHALRIPDPMDRLALTQKLLEEGVPPREANRALVHAVRTYGDDVSLLRALAARADTADGEALATAARARNPDAVELL